MRRRLLSAVPVFAICAIPACSQRDEATELRTILAQDTGVAWAVQPGFLAPERPVRVAGGTPEESARAFFTRYADNLHASRDPRDLRVEATTIADDGTTAVRFSHVLPGTDIPLFDAASIGHFTKDGEAYYFETSFRDDLGAVPKTAAFSKEDAMRVGKDAVITACGASGATAKDAVLGVETDGTPRLVWRVTVSAEDSTCASPEALVDATTGAILGARDGAKGLWDIAPGFRFHHLNDKLDLKTIDVESHWHIGSPTTFTLESQVSPKVTTSVFFKAKENKICESATMTKWDDTGKVKGVAVDAHFYGFHALRFMKELSTKMGDKRAQYDLTLVVHDNSPRTDSGMISKYATNESTIYFGDGDFQAGGNKLSGASAIDIVAHEMTHGVIDRTSKLAYSNESGSLTESFCDVMGVSAKEWFNVTRDDAKQTIVGDRRTKDGRGIRDMRKPSTHGDPSRVKEQAKCSEDPNCIYKNTGIPNRAFTMMTIGGKHETSGIWVQNSIGWQRGRELWFKTVTQLAPKATFQTLALAQVAEAAKQIIAEPQLLQAVACAWHSVGVLSLGPEIHPALAAVSCPEPLILGEGPSVTGEQQVSNPNPNPGPPPKPTGSSCDGRANGVACNDNAMYSAYVCEGGQIAGSLACLDPQKRCKKAGPDDFTATVDAKGELVCE